MKVWIRGAGELASAAAWTLKSCGYRVLLSELPVPLAIRRTVTFSDAMLVGESDVESIRAKLITDWNPNLWMWGKDIPIGPDDPDLIPSLNPDVIIDGRMLKKSVKDMRLLAPFTIGLGPGFDTGGNCHAVIETQRGHNLGRVIWSGAAQPDSRVPGVIGGQSSQRVIYAEADGKLVWNVDFGDLVSRGDVLGVIADSVEVKAKTNGIVRGLISPKVPMIRGLKIADVDPRGAEVDFRTISDKARSVARGCLEAVLIAKQRKML